MVREGPPLPWFPEDFESDEAERQLIIYSVAFLDQSLKQGNARSKALADMIRHYEALIGGSFCASSRAQEKARRLGE